MTDLDFAHLRARVEQAEKLTARIEALDQLHGILLGCTASFDSLLDPWKSRWERGYSRDELIQQFSDLLADWCYRERSALRKQFEAL